MRLTEYSGDEEQSRWPCEAWVRFWCLMMCEKWRDSWCTLCPDWYREQGAVNFVIELLGDEEFTELLPDLCTALKGLSRQHSNKRKAKYVFSC